jgi:hypothetical protein
MNMWPTVIGQINHDPDLPDQRYRRHVSIVYIFGVYVNPDHIEPIEAGSINQSRTGLIRNTREIGHHMYLRSGFKFLMHFRNRNLHPI